MPKSKSNKKKVVSAEEPVVEASMEVKEPSEAIEATETSTDTKDKNG